MNFNIFLCALHVEFSIRSKINISKIRFLRFILLGAENKVKEFILCDKNLEFWIILFVLNKLSIRT